MTVSEPEYDDADRVALLKVVDEEKRPRNTLGIPLEEATDPAHQYDWEPDLPTTDFAKARLNRHIESYRKQYPEADMDALMWSVRLREGTRSE